MDNKNHILDFLCDDGDMLCDQGGKKMTAKEFAAMIDGAESGRELTEEEEAIAKTSGLVVVFGASDDLMEFHGAIDNERGVYGGGEVYLNADGLLKLPECDLDHEPERCPYYKEAQKKAKLIRAIWCPRDTDFSWCYKTDIPHEVFRVLEDGEHYCLGIVFSVGDLA